MKWEKITLLREVPSGIDDLGNEIMTLQPVKETDARFTPEVDIPVSIDNRDVSSNVQFFSLPIRADFLPAFTHVEYKDLTYKLETIAALSPRWTIIKAVIYEAGITGA